jgi:hypothetical protein
MQISSVGRACLRSGACAEVVRGASGEATMTEAMVGGVRHQYGPLVIYRSYGQDKSLGRIRSPSRIYQFCESSTRGLL